MKTNESLQKDVQDALKWEPLLHSAEIGVTVKDGVVTLLGTVDSYTKKLEAEHAAKMVSGVKAVVEKIEIKYGNYGKKSDEDIAKEIINAFKWNWSVPDDKMKVKVENGWVTIEGTVTWNYQKEAASTAVRNLLGVLGITNNIVIKSECNDKIEKSVIENALLRNWSIDDEDIKVEVKANEVTLSGTVDSYYEKDEAERIAWNAPGVISVNNELALYNEM
ncbi:BON domain-containing protein [Flavobacterium psychrophilum]|uniref:BON domain-containing protein n=1 Tax=Flavobacterium psychrophilum TaxID=96345 RepID=UPI00090A3229|nr:BON domain-containing protein [Flavobacterium psychrophilum]EKT2072606.1 BON domain-containing protein [Flavobacterium psychrophilum]EKT4492119.1 BON domain-containing protein [Flavobacterium psychrophilum]SHH93250.1 Probable transport-associated protein [Flavobacterium psychrophilum]